ncbi:hypothetical protein GCM10010231_33190 [Streptomyces sindenensis]|nr:hypothetical protein GCM10010231_33190 [Streptomyces sindenensis]
MRRGGARQGGKRERGACGGVAEGHHREPFVEGGARGTVRCGGPDAPMLVSPAVRRTGRATGHM